MLCPQCGAPVVVDPTAKVSVPVVAVWHIRDHRVTYRLRDCELAHCSACEWTHVLRMKGVLW
jgi:hypothetical protein